ncbi:MAG: N-acetylmuramic acid 6-phosphate etherase, partial [Planctomycetota bacterium]
AAAGAQAAREAKVGGRDLVIGIAASGRTPFVRGALEEARSLGARTALVTSNPAVATEGPHPAHNVCVLDTGPEVLSGSTRLKAGTATKMALNAITTAAFASVGKVYGNLMVDLMATNKKLEARSARIVQRLCTLDEAAAKVALQRAGGRLKEAVVMHELAVTIEQASAQLKEASGCLRRALANRENEEEAEPEGDAPQR